MKSDKLTCEKARNISIVKTLENLGHFPNRKSEKEAWFLSPFRSETQASFKVSLTLNRWYDHGLGKGGNIIDLVMELNNFSVSETLNFLSNGIGSLCFHQQPKNLDRAKKYDIRKVKKLENNKALIDYLKTRCINIEIATQFCCEIYYKINGQKYFSIGFINDENGFELRNKYFKGCIGKKAITSLKYGHDKVSIFEGFMDFLSYKTLYENSPIEQDYIICNSIALVKKILPKLDAYNEVYICFDNDSSGQKATQFLKKKNRSTIDCSMAYNGFKDINDYLCSKVS